MHAGTFVRSTGFWQARKAALDAVPPVPAFLGFAGAIPFLSLTPAVVNAAGFSQFVDILAGVQVEYGAVVVSFLGAVHWGLAMGGTLTGERSAALTKERYVWSVFPALAALSALQLDPAQGSVAISMLLGICYLSDSNFAKSGHVPGWYHTMRGYLTILSILSLLATAVHYLMKDVEKMNAMMAVDDAAAQEKMKPR
ncbi:MAG: hypothetical protein WDW36_002473 [Sanguina aurantia]